jgi:PASTA domain
MAKEWSPWRDGRRAWERLKGWLQDGPSEGQDRDEAAALTALSDVGLLRRLLDQAELVAVRAARRQGRSWAEIATRLGVARQSAWEKWRELDEAEPPADPAAAGREQEVADAAQEAAWQRRRRSTVTVPNVVGMSVDAARAALGDRGLFAIGADPDDPSLPETGTPGVVVTDQSPESGARVPSGARVRLWVERGGGSGVREPRQPKPEPRFGRAMNDELSDEAVG